MNWSAILDSPGLGKPPYSTLTNAVRVLEQDPLWGPDKLYHDEFLDRIRIVNSPTRDWRDDDDYKLTVYMQDTTGMTRMADHLVAKAVRLVARQRPHHVVREWLGTLGWDEVPRIAHAFEDYWGADQQASDYVRAASANFFIGMIARVMAPGCKLDTMPVFEGKQGIKKSSALDVLGGEWFAVIAEAVANKDFLQCMRGKWILEIGELQSFSRSDIAHVKNMMSTRSDNYRPSYGRTNMEFPRQCVFAGTVNSDDWGNDDTGLRRFWPIQCGDIDIEGLRAARSQLFAEALVCYLAGASWWDMPAQAEQEQAERQQFDEWTDAVTSWAHLEILKGASHVTVADAAAHAIKIPLSQLDRASQMRIGRVLRLARWQRKNLRDGATVLKIWVPPVATVATSVKNEATF